MNKHLILSLLAALAFFTCKDKEDENKASFYTDKEDCTTVDATTNTYELAVKDIMNNSCALGGCHDATTKSGGYEMATYAGSKTAFANGIALCTINHDCMAMPQGGSKLPAATIKQLTCWVKNGAPE